MVSGPACRKTLNMALTSITNWSSGLLTSMQQENAKLAQQIAAQHSDMVKWLVQVRLLHQNTHMHMHQRDAR